MASKKPEIKTEKLEREYIIPLRVEWKKVPRYKRAAKAIKAIKQFLVRHMKIRDRDLNKIKVDGYLNETIWARGIKKPPAKIKVRAIKEGEIVRAELVEYSDKLKFKKVRAGKREKNAVESIEKKKTMMQKMKQGVAGKEKEVPKSEDEKKEEKVEEKEKAKAGAEVTQKIEKAAAKQIKHAAGGKTKQKAQPQRKALAK